MNSAELVNLILEKLRRVKFLVIINRTSQVRFIWGHNEYTAVVTFDNTVAVYKWVDGGTECVVDNYQIWVEGMLNGMVRNDAGELVECSK
jgi:hypothetical protein